MTYQEIIIAANGCAPADAPEIERIMRDRFVFGSELDGKSAKQLVCGAPMGRCNIIDQNPGKTFDRRVDLYQGYDRGGAYWGIGPELRVRYNASLSHIEFYRK